MEAVYRHHRDGKAVAPSEAEAHVAEALNRSRCCGNFNTHFRPGRALATSGVQSTSTGVGADDTEMEPRNAGLRVGFLDRWQPNTYGER